VSAGARHAEIDHMHTCVRYTMGWGNYDTRAQSDMSNQPAWHISVLGAPPPVVMKKKVIVG